MSDRPLSELAREITHGAVRLSAATAAWLMLVAEFDERGGWGGAGLRSCAHWLSWQCGLAPGAAREHVRVARALRRLPLTRAAFLEGRISYAKARALTRVVDPACEEGLLDFALAATASQVERTVRAIRRVEKVDEETVMYKQRFDARWDDDGMLDVRARLAPEEGAAFLTGVESLAERYARRDRAEAKRVAAGHDLSSVDEDIARRYDESEEVRCARERTAARKCAAMAALAGAAVHIDRRAGDPPRREVVVHVDAGVLADDAAAGQAHIEGGPALPAADVRRMLCEATVVTMLANGREPLAIGRKRRLATRAQRRALWRRDGGCARPGCPEARLERLHAHHMRHWLFGGRTDLTNLVLLCDADHGLVHDLDLVMTRRDGELVVLDADGRRVWGRADAAFDGGIEGLSAENSFVGIQPLDEAIGRRPVEAGGSGQTSCAAGAPSSRGRRGRRSGSAGRTSAALSCADVSAVLFPNGEPPALPDTLESGGERMQLAWAVSVLMDNRDIARRLAAEVGSAA